MSVSWPISDGPPSVMNKEEKLIAVLVTMSPHKYSRAINMMRQSTFGASA